MLVRIAPGLAGLEEHSRATHVEMFIVVMPSCLGLKKELGSNVWRELGRAIACFMCFLEQGLIGTMEPRITIVSGRELEADRGRLDVTFVVCVGSGLSFAKGIAGPSANAGDGRGTRDT